MVERMHTLIIVQHVPLMVPACIVGFPYGHGVVGEVNIAVIALFDLLIRLKLRFGKRRGREKEVGENLQKSAEEPC